jgi:hypothetical protein
MGGKLRIAIDSKRAHSGVENYAVDEPIADQISESPQPFDLVRTDGHTGLHFDSHEHPVAAFEDEVNLTVQRCSWQSVPLRLTAKSRIYGS